MRLFIGLALTAICIAVLAFAVDWPLVFDILKSANLALVALSVLILLASLWAKATRWRLLLPPAPAATTTKLFRILNISYLINNILPARLGDVARVAVTSRLPGIRLGHVLSSLITERVADAAVLVVCFLAVSPFLPVSEDYERWLRFAWLTIAIGAVLVVTLVFSRGGIRWIARHPQLGGRIPISERIRTEVASFAEGWRRLFASRQSGAIWLWSFGAWLTAFAINYTLMLALDIDAPIAVAVLITCVTNLAMLVPSSPGYIGVFHAAATLALLPFDVSSSLAFSFAVLAHLVNVIPVSILGAIFLMMGRETADLDWRHPDRTAAEVAAESVAAGPAE